MRTLAKRPSERWQIPTKWLPADTIDAVFALEREYRSILDDLLVPHGVTYAQFSVLRKIRDGASTLQQLMNHFGYTRPNASKLVDALVTAGLVRREADRKDKRAIALSLSNSASRTVAASEKVVDAIHERIYPTGWGYHRRFQSMVSAMHQLINRERRRPTD